MSSLPGPRPPLVWALPLLKVEGLFCLKEPWPSRAFRFSLVRSSFLGAEIGDSRPEEKRGSTISSISILTQSGFTNKKQNWHTPETKKNFNYKIQKMLLVLEDHPVWSGALSALMGSERLPQLGPGARPAQRVGGGSLKGIKTFPTKQIQGCIIPTAEMLFSTTNSHYCLQRRLLWPGILHML